MAIGELDHRGIPVPMASKAFRGANEEVHLGGGEILAAPPVRIGPLPRWQDAVWGRAGDARRCPSRDACTVEGRGKGRSSHSMLQTYFPEKRRRTESSRTE
jgi:hypothetical protein